MWAYPGPRQASFEETLSCSQQSTPRNEHLAPRSSCFVLRPPHDISISPEASLVTAGAASAPIKVDARVVQLHRPQLALAHTLMGTKQKEMSYEFLSHRLTNNVQPAPEMSVMCVYPCCHAPPVSPLADAFVARDHSVYGTLSHPPVNGMRWHPSLPTLSVAAPSATLPRPSPQE
jgi:hypothetical protein